jgi:hypothetical protein
VEVLLRTDPENRLDRAVRLLLREAGGRALENLAWLREHMPPFFFITMREEAEAVAALCLGLLRLSADRRLVLLDRDKEFMAARLDLPGSLYESLQTLQPREISYAEMAHSYAPVPGTNHDLEFQRFEFDRKGDAEIASAGEPEIPASIKSAVYAELRKFTPAPPAREREKLLSLLWLNNEDYVRDSRRAGSPGFSGCSIRAGTTRAFTSMRRMKTGTRPKSDGRAGSSSPSGTPRRRTTSPRSWRCSTVSTWAFGAPTP